MKNFKSKNYKRGLIGTIVTIVIALLIVSYFGFDIRGVVESEIFQKNWTFVKEILMTAWREYLQPGFNFLYEFISGLIHQEAEKI